MRGVNTTLLYHVRHQFIGSIRVRRWNNRRWPASVTVFHTTVVAEPAVFAALFVSIPRGEHHALYDVFARAFSLADIPVAKEPAGLLRTDDKRADGIDSHRMEGRQALHAMRIMFAM